MSVAAGTGCNSEARTLGKTAEALCGVDADGAGLASLPIELQAHVRPADLDFARGAGRVAQAAELPGGVACKTKDVAILGSIANVSLTRTSGDGRTAEYTIKFVRPAENWLADYQLPEKDASRKAEDAKVAKLRDEAVQLANDFQLEAAKEKLGEARKLRPTDVSLTKELAEVDAMIERRVANGWFKGEHQNAMTDKKDVLVLLPASETIQGDLKRSRPLLKARCREGKLDVMIDVDQVVESSVLDGTSVRYRFDQEPPQRETMTQSTNMHGLFAARAAQWLEQLMAHSTGRLLVEIPLVSAGRRQVTFDLGGADKALPLVKAACQK